MSRAMLFLVLSSLLSLLQGVASAKTTFLEYNITWVHRNPDGRFDRPVMGINGQWPIPALNVTKGEHLVVTVRNQLGNETTSVHWHGLYQNGTAHMDGPPGVTQCEIPHNDYFVYDFIVDQPGTYWFHSHTRGQYPDGLRAPLIVHDLENPFKNDYDEEIVLSFSDWYHDPMRKLLKSFLSVTNPTGAEPVPKSALINDSQNITVAVQPGKTYMIRMVNMAAFAGMYVWFQGCTMRVVEVDGIYTTPAETDMLYFTAGQRYSILLTIGSETTNIPFMASMDEELFDALPSDLQSNVTGWLVTDSTLELPRPSAIEAFSPFDDFSLKPLDSLPALVKVDRTVTLDLKMDNLGDGANYAFFNNNTYVEPAVPALYTVMSSGAHAENPIIYGSHTNSFVLKANETVEVVLNNNDDGKHPFHLHGHAFQVIARSDEDAGAYSFHHSSTAPSIPMRRDTILVQPNGHAVLRFRSDNPGVWLFHCHIEWHVASGLIATFIEAPLELQKTLSIPDAHHDLCFRNYPPISVSGNAAGNEVDYLNLKGEPAPPSALPEGFTTKGIVAIVISALNALIMVVAIARYGLYQTEGNESGASGANDASGVDAGRPSEERPLLAEPNSR